MNSKELTLRHRELFMAFSWNKEQILQTWRELMRSWLSDKMRAFHQMEASLINNKDLARTGLIWKSFAEVSGSLRRCHKGTTRDLLAWHTILWVAKTSKSSVIYMYSPADRAISCISDWVTIQTLTLSSQPPLEAVLGVIDHSINSSTWM